MKSQVLALLGCAALLLGSDASELTTDDLPKCGADTYLLYHGGKIVCASKRPPDCTGQLLTVVNVDGRSELRCTPAYTDKLMDADRQTMTDLDKRIDELAVELAALGSGTTLAATFAGITTATTTGRIEYPQVPAGLPAANARCAAQFGSVAHMCAAPEIFGAALKQSLDPTVDIARAWLYMPTWNAPVSSGEEAQAGLGDNCGGYTDGTTDHDWSGMAVGWSLMISNVRGFHFYHGSAAPCDIALPIACCK